jgi:glycosyltransferase involved in cell wall biosynthesis
MIFITFLILTAFFLFIKHSISFADKLKNEKKGKFYYILEKINNWIKLCQNETLSIKYSNSVKNPKITALISLFNSQDYISTALKSVQNQLLSDIEILVVEDCSTDNSYSIIQKLQQNDKRIKIIKNKKNRGALYSKSIGILKSTGKYTMMLDSDDLFANENIFKICFKKATKNKIDILEFSGFNRNTTYFKLDTNPKIPYYLRFKKANKIIYQPKLSYFIYKKRGKYKYKLIDGFLWGKCINSKIFKKSLQIVGSEVYEQKINYGDDRIINFILFKVATSFMYIKEYGIIYNFNNNSITHANSFSNKCHDELINILSIYNYTNNSKEVNIAAFEVISRWKIIIFPGLDIYNYNTAKTLINKLVINKYVCHFNKLKLFSILFNLTNLTKSNNTKLFFSI